MRIKYREHSLNTTEPAGLVIIAWREGSDCRTARIIDGVYASNDLWDKGEPTVDIIAARWAERPECKGYRIFVADLSRITDELIHAFATEVD